MVAFLFGIVLILLGMLGAASFLALKMPATAKYIAAIRPHEEVIGIIGIFFGISALIDCVFNIGFYMYEPLLAILLVVSGALSLFLGLIFGLVFVSKRLRDPAVSFPILPRIEAFRAKIAPRQKIFGEAALACGSIYVLLFVIHLFH